MLSNYVHINQACINIYIIGHGFYHNHKCPSIEPVPLFRYCEHQFQFLCEVLLWKYTSGDI